MSQPEHEAGAFFDVRASVYDSAYDRRGADGHALRARMEVVLRLVGSGPGEALDAGMGPGRLCGELAARGWAASGVDASDEMVGLARRRLPEAEARLVRGEIEALPFADETFDAVLATGVLEYSDPPRALHELSRVLRPGGLAVVSYPNPRALYGIWKTRAFYPVIRIVKRQAGRPTQAQPHGSGRVPPGRFRELLEAARLEPADTVYTSFLVIPSPLDLLLPSAAESLGKRLEGSGPRVSGLLATQVVYSARKS